MQKDISGNVHKIRTKFETNRIKFMYLDSLIDDDLLLNGGKLNVATEGLLWLKRFLSFFYFLFLYSLQISCLIELTVKKVVLLQCNGSMYIKYLVVMNNEQLHLYS